MSESTARGAGTPAPLGPRRDGGPGRLKSIPVFYRQVVAELRKVIWPDRQQLITYTTVVLVFVTVMVAIVALLDLGFSQAVVAVFGGDTDAATPTP